MSGDFKPWLQRIATGGRLTEVEAEAAFATMMTGGASPAQMGAFLMGLRVRGESLDEITGAARSLRAAALTVRAPADALDTCGTGGDGSGTFNVSTAAAFVMAACGVPIAKHGNRAVSSKSGSADILQALGVVIDLPVARIEQAIAEIGIGFLMAPRHHAATRYVAETRQELGTRTLFNLLGPLSNPAGVRRQVMGVYAPEWVRPAAEVLRRLGAAACWVVHGDGLDELTTTGTSVVAALADGIITEFTVTPEAAGLPRARRQDLLGASPAANAETMRAIFAGQPGPIRDIILLNAAAGLIVAGKAAGLPAGIALAAQALDQGGAQRILDQLIAFSRISL